MQSFIKRIRVDNYSPEFFFNKVYTAVGIKYHLSVIDMNQVPHSFYMEEILGTFKIMEASKLPEWIQKIERKLGLAIIDNATKLN